MPVSLDPENDVRVHELRDQIRTQLDELPRFTIPPLSQDAKDVIIAAAEGKISTEDLRADEHIVAHRAANAEAKRTGEPISAAWLAIGDLIDDLSELDPSLRTLELARQWGNKRPMTDVAPTRRHVRAIKQTLSLNGWGGIVDVLTRPGNQS